MKPRRVAIAAVVVLLAVIVATLLLQSRDLGTSANGRIHFISLSQQSGTNLNILVSSRPEAFVRDILFRMGFNKVQRTSYPMTSPPNSHLFTLEYSGNTGAVNPWSIQADLVEPDGTKYGLIPVGGDRYGVEKRKFAYWILNGVPHIDPKSRLKVYLPVDSPTLLPVNK